MTNDITIRAAFHKKKLASAHTCTDTLVIDELGLAHAKARIDIATINGCIHGYEIKSDADTLARLSKQIEIYKATLQKLTIVCAEKHVQHSIKIAPSWVGIVSVSRGVRGAVIFRTVRKPQMNPEVNAKALAHLLWRSEALDIVTEITNSKAHKYDTRAKLYDVISERLSISEITNRIKLAMFSREDWRDLLPPC
ncbi:sce7726 family protein [Pseudovibrio ascidiaceicola]|uniref:sce7726 family protein n=1 Tax=Pseudovibrio ascidiaceicola TaxID=285279 RepID=UPI003D36691F